MQDMPEPETNKKSRHRCSNPSCGKTFSEPKIIHVCPYCLTEIKDDQKLGFQHWFGYLGDRENGEEIPKECIECARSIDCMLKKASYSSQAVNEIKKWWQ